LTNKTQNKYKTDMKDKDTIILHLLNRTIRAFIQYPDDLKSSVEPASNGKVALVFRPHMNDMSRVIGGGAKMFTALQTIVRVIGLRHGRRYNLEILEPNIGQRSEVSPYYPDPKFSADDVVVPLLADIARAVWESEPTISIRPIGDDISSIVLNPNCELADMRIAEIESALVVIFTAIGKNKGHRLNIAIGNDKVSDRAAQ
jgi:predicted RNA-binding protein YlqC (UPF0109 family)